MTLEGSSQQPSDVSMGHTKAVRQFLHYSFSVTVTSRWSSIGKEILGTK